MVSLSKEPEKHFNPHEREARDWLYRASQGAHYNFNPHEREARDTSRAATGSPVPLF